MKYEESFGVIPLRQHNGLWEVFIIQHNRGHYWGFPKGHAEAGETPEQAAFRELKEETNLDFVSFVKADPFVENYQFTMKGEKISKRVIYFAAIVSGEVILQAQEIQNGAWVDVREAIDRVTHQEGKTILINLKSVLV